MFTENGHSAQALGDRVRAASRHRGSWPKISVWHGTCDAIVNPCNGESLIRQWTNVHGLSEIPARQESVEGHTRRVWTDANGEALIEAFSIKGMAHGVPLATTKDGCGRGHFSWMPESPLRTTSLASGDCTNLWLLRREPRRLYPQSFGFRQTPTPLSSLQRLPKACTVRREAHTLKVRSTRIVIRSTQTPSSRRHSRPRAFLCRRFLQQWQARIQPLPPARLSRLP